METIEASSVARGSNMAPRCGLGRIALPLIGGLLVLFLTGCESNSTLNTNVVTPLAGTPQVQAKPVAFAPVIGAPAKISSKMNEGLVAAAGQKNIPVAGLQEAEYTIRGYLVAGADAKGTKLSYIWDITDKSGKRAKRFQGDELIEGKKGGDPWALVDDAAIQRISTKTADEVSIWMASNIAIASASVTASTQPQAQTAQAPASQTPASSPQPSVNALSAQTPQTTAAAAPAASAPALPAAVVVQPVTGAPGDGQASLTDAMRRQLEAAGVKIASGNEPNAYTVKGTVQLGAADGGQQPITIRWLVVDPSGKTMEKAVVQRNKVPQGSLDGPWGQIADLAAGEAAKSIAKLLKQQGQGQG